MARVAVLSHAAILDTSWLLELYRVPGHFKNSRASVVGNKVAELSDAGSELFVTVPVLLEVASHITRVSSGSRRRKLSEKLRDDIKTAIERGRPWTIATVGSEILLRSHDILRLAERFLELSVSDHYSFADISVIDLATELRRPSRRVEILAFDQQLESYSDSLA